MGLTSLKGSSFKLIATSHVALVPNKGLTSTSVIISLRVVPFENSMFSHIPRFTVWIFKNNKRPQFKFKLGGFIVKSARGKIPFCLNWVDSLLKVQHVLNFPSKYFYHLFIIIYYQIIYFWTSKRRRYGNKLNRFAMANENFPINFFYTNSSRQKWFIECNWNFF